MSLISKVKSIMTPAGLVCPRCEKPLEGHDEKACQRRLSRRHFLAAGLGAITATALSQPPGAFEGELKVLVGAKWTRIGHIFAVDFKFPLQFPETAGIGSVAPTKAPRFVEFELDTRTP